jgi:hypothetical protein
MKKIILFVLLVVALAGCEKSEDSANQTVLVNVFYESSGKEHTASPTLVRLYREKASEIDFEESRNSMWNDQDITLKNGTIATPSYTSDSFSGINTIENVKNGTYTIVIFFKPDGYSFATFYYFGYKEITVSNEIGLQLLKIVFKWGMKIDGGDAGSFVKF